MGKRIGFVGIVLIFIAALSGFYIYLKQQQNTVNTAFKAVPINAAIIIDISDPVKLNHDLITKNKFSSELFELGDLRAYNQKLSNIDTLLLSFLESSNLFKDDGLLISLHELGKNNFEPLFYTLAGGRFEANQILKNIEAYFSQSGSVNFTRYNQARLFEYIPNNKSESTVFYAYYKGILVMGPAEILVQEALRQVDSDVGLVDIPSLSKLRTTAGNYADANIYIQFEEFRKMLGKVLNKQVFDDAEIRQFSEWGVLDFNLKNSTLLFNGYSTSSDYSNRVTKVFQGQTAQNIRFIKYIPNGPEAFTIIGLSDVKLFRQKLADYMEDIGQKDRFIINEQSVRNAFGEKAVQGLIDLARNEIATIKFSDGSTLFAMQTKGFRDANELVESMFEKYCSSTNTSLSAYKKNFKIDNDTEFPIYKMPLTKLPTRLFGPWFNSNEAEYLAVFDKYIVLTDNYKTLTNFIYNNVLQKTIAFNGAYKEFENFLSTKTNFYHFSSLSGAGSFLQNMLTNQAYSYYKTNMQEIQEFYGIGYQFSVENNYIYNNLIFRHQPGSILRASTEWESRLDALTNFKPTLVRNHYSNEKDIFIQDANNTVYLVNKAGRILWKQPLEEAILGQVYQVDYFKNGKLQLLFNTKSKLHLLDRNGNYVERYPVKLKESATAPMAVFDYEKRKNYRIFIPAANKKVYCYNLEGKIVTGFNFSGSDYMITKPLQYVRDGGKDYLIATDENRTYILDRKGNERIKLDLQFIPSKNNQYIYQKASGNNKACLITTSSEGKIMKVFFDGTVESIIIDSFNKDHFFNVQDIDVDGVNEYVFINANKLIVYSQTGKKVFDYKFSSDIKHAPSFYKFSSKKIGIGITEVGADKIYMFNSKGKLFNGFPLKGHTRFSVGIMAPGTSRFNLLVGGDDNYLYNYKLN